jgi:hypothetical protein
MGLGDVASQRLIERSKALDRPRVAHASLVGCFWSGYCSPQIYHFADALVHCMYCLGSSLDGSVLLSRGRASFLRQTVGLLLALRTRPLATLTSLKVGAGQGLRAAALKMLVTTAILSTVGNYINMRRGGAREDVLQEIVIADHSSVSHGEAWGFHGQICD